MTGALHGSALWREIDPEELTRRRAPGAPTRRDGPDARRPVKVAVLVDLELRPDAGGHVKFWERIAHAALDRRDIELAIHFSGRRPEVVPLGPNVRYIVEPPRFSTERLPFLSHVPAHTDLAPRHPRVLRQLRDCDVIHTTDAYFAYAGSAMSAVRRWGIPYVTSVHTNTPDVARLFTGLTIERVCGSGAVSDLLVRRLKLPELVARRMERRLTRHQRGSAFTFVARRDQLAAALASTGGRAGLLRRGLDHAFFTPAKRDRGWLQAKLGVEPDCVAVLCVGVLTASKNTRVLADAFASAGLPGVKLICAGDGPERGAIQELLGPRAVCPGHVDHGTLSRLYASADIFAFPSEIEEHANVVLEALSSGLPALVSVAGGMGCVVAHGQTGLLLPGRDPRAWAAALGELASDRAERAAMSTAARRYAEGHIPSWSQVLGDDLVPRWQAAVRAGQSAVAPWPRARPMALAGDSPDRA